MRRSLNSKSRILDLLGSTLAALWDGVLHVVLEPSHVLLSAGSVKCSQRNLGSQAVMWSSTKVRHGKSKTESIPMEKIEN